MKYKVKYTKKEYREEYLNSEEWKKLRDLIMSTSPKCQCCENLATDVHHLVYKNIVDIKITDLIPVCKNCHNLIHEAIDEQWISQDIRDFDEIRKKTLSINTDKEYQKYKLWLKSKHYLSEEEIEIIKSLQGFVMQKISGLIKRNVWYDKISDMKFYGKHILKIRKFIQTALYRRKEK